MPVSVSSPLQGGVKCKLAWSRLGFDKFGSFCLSSQFRHICLKGLTSLEVFVSSQFRHINLKVEA